MSAPDEARRGLLLVGAAIVLTGLNLRVAVTSVGPVLQEIEQGLGISSGAAGLVTTMPVLCFALIGFVGPSLSARFRDAHVLGGALLVMCAGLVLRAVAGAFWLFLLGTVLAMVGGAIGNVLLPSLVKRYFPHRTGALVGAYSTAMAIGAAVVAISTAPIAAAFGDGGWRWGLGIWTVLPIFAAVPWLFVRPAPGATRSSHAAVPMRPLLRSPTAIALTVFFGMQSIVAYVVIGWSPQYLRDSGLAAGTAGLLLGLNQVVNIPVSAVVPSLTVRPGLQRPLLAGSIGCYTAGWLGLWLAPLAVPWAWMVILSLGMGAFPMVLTLIGLRARAPETVAALSTVTQSWGYLLAAFGPLLVGLLRGATGSYTGMFVLMLACVAVLAVTGWLVTRHRYVEDEVPGWSPAAQPVAVGVSSDDGSRPG
jgi:CP family cyanate transporter-like MFS transporter